MKAKRNDIPKVQEFVESDIAEKVTSSNNDDHERNVDEEPQSRVVAHTACHSENFTFISRRLRPRHANRRDNNDAWKGNSSVTDERNFMKKYEIRGAQIVREEEDVYTKYLIQNRVRRTIGNDFWKKDHELPQGAMSTFWISQGSTLTNHKSVVRKIKEELDSKGVINIGAHGHEKGRTKKSNSAQNEFEIENLLKYGYDNHNAPKFKVRWRVYDEAGDFWEYVQSFHGNPWRAIAMKMKFQTVL